MAWIADQAFGSSDAWRIHRKARAADRPEITQIVTEYLNRVVGYISLINLGTAEPPPAVRLAILATIAFGETLVDDARDTDVPRDVIARIIIEALVAALDAARVADGK